MHIKDVLIDQNLRRKLNGFVNNKIVPNLIMSGVAGIGKSTIVDCIAHDVYEKEYSTYVYKLNSSLEKNIKLLQELLENFCKRKLSETQTKKKMFIIDDMDNIPNKLQSVIALMIEKYPNISFAFTCNNSTDIIELIQSRCIMLYLQRPTQEQIINHLERICKHEKYPYSREALEKIYFISQGDVRLSLNQLQVICEGFNEVTLENIDNICDTPNIVVLQNIINLCIDKKITDVIAIVNELCDDGFYCSDILGGMFDILKSNDCKIADEIKIPFLTIIGKSRYLVSEKIDSNIQLNRCIIKLCGENASVSENS